jgi:hypothetical protein
MALIIVVLFTIKHNVDNMASKGLRVISYQGTRNFEAGYKFSRTTETLIGYIVCYSQCFFNNRCNLSFLFGFPLSIIKSLSLSIVSLIICQPEALE